MNNIHDLLKRIQELRSLIFDTNKNLPIDFKSAFINVTAKLFAPEALVLTPTNLWLIRLSKLYHKSPTNFFAFAPYCFISADKKIQQNKKLFSYFLIQ